MNASQGLPDSLRTAPNLQVLRFLAPTSAHSDVAEVLTRIVRPLGGVRLSCPDWQRYRYVVADQSTVIFAFAMGMDTLGFRLPEELHPEALTGGGKPCPGAGPGWYSFPAFGSLGPAGALESWARHACLGARSGLS